VLNRFRLDDVVLNCDEHIFAVAVGNQNKPGRLNNKIRSFVCVQSQLNHA
jgi:hypothetical protein